MDIVSMLTQAVDREMNARSAAEREELIGHHERFDKLVREGIVQPEPYGVALTGAFTQPAGIALGAKFA